MKQPMTIAELRRALVADSIERKKLVDRLVKLVRQDEHDRTMGEARALQRHVRQQLHEAGIGPKEER